MRLLLALTLILLGTLLLASHILWCLIVMDGWGPDVVVSQEPDARLQRFLIHFRWPAVLPMFAGFALIAWDTWAERRSHRKPPVHLRALQRTSI